MLGSRVGLLFVAMFFLSGCDLLTKITGGETKGGNSASSSTQGSPNQGSGGTNNATGNQATPTPTPTPTATPAPTKMKPPMHKAAAGKDPVGLDPQQLFDWYKIDAYDDDGQGAAGVLAIIDAFVSPTLVADCNKFSDTFNLPPCNIQVADMTVAGNNGASAALVAGWNGEASLDVQWAHAVAPGAKIIYVGAKSSSTNDLLAAVTKGVQLGAKQVSMSWGGPESAALTQFDNVFNVPGVTFFASSGDSGTGVSWPAVSPNVVSVGGTRLVLNANGEVTGETAWSGSGGGVSAYTAKPAFQNGVVKNVTTTKRSVPDVAYNADPASGVSVYCTPTSCGQAANMPWIAVGGTSAGSPQWAGLSAVWNSRRGAGVELRDPLTKLYKYQTTDYRDIVTGANCSGNGCDPIITKAATGYDQVTGVGSPKADTLISDMIAVQ